MAMTHDYLDFLNQRVDIAPANSQEELQAAETIATLMSQHDVEPSIEEFDAPVVSGMGAAVLSIVVFLGVLVSGFGVIALSIVGFVLAAIPAILAVLRMFGIEPSFSFGPQARSQNVVAVHRATGPLVTKGSRRIVVVAHYDTPRENFLYTSPVAPYVPILERASRPCSYVSAVCALVQVMVFIPSVARVVVWIVGIVAAVPGVLVAAGSIHEHFSSCTLGANDNKSGVAALLGVMENVRPSGLVPTPREPEQSRDLDEVDELEEAPAPEEEPAAEGEPVPAETAAAPAAEVPVSASAAETPARMSVAEVREGAPAADDVRGGSEPVTAPEDLAVPEDGLVQEGPATVFEAAPIESAAEDFASPEPVAEETPAPVPMPEPQPEPEPQPLEVVGTRHGEDVLRELQILPDSCVIEYYVPGPQPAPAASEPARTVSLPIAKPAPRAWETVTPESLGAEVPAPGKGEDEGESPFDGILERLKIFVHSIVERVREFLSSHGHDDGNGASDQGGASARALTDGGDASSSEAAHDPEPTAPEPVTDTEQTAATQPAPVEPLSEVEPVPVEDTAPAPVPAAPASDPAAERISQGTSDLGAARPQEQRDEASSTAPMAAAAAPSPAEADGTLSMEPVTSAPRVSGEDLMSTGRFSIVMDNEARGVGPKDSSGLTAMDESTLDIDRPVPVRKRPAAPDDPEWGKASFRPSVSSVARRASLFDLPDPRDSESDPLGDPSATRVATRRTPSASAQDESQRSSAVQAPKAATSAVSSPQPIETLSSEHNRDHKAAGGFMDRLRGAFSGKQDGSDGWLGSDDQDDDTWRGGAAMRSDLRMVGEEGGAPTEEDLREAALRLGDDALVAHDIWFVALGGSSLDHAGMRSFLSKHRSEIRGSFVINLDCVGAGDLTLLTHEGRNVKRRGDRRLGRIINNVARDFHIEMGQRDYSWTSTDAWVAMRSSMRALTIMGVDENGLPALSHTPMDVPENVSGDQTALVTELVTEAIRRS